MRGARSYVPAPCTTGSIQKAIKWLLQRGKQVPGRLIVVVPVLDQLTDGMLGEVLGKHAKAARKDRRLVVDSATIEFQTHATLHLDSTASGVVMLWPGSAEPIGKVDERAPQADILCVAWLPADSAWLEAAGFDAQGATATLAKQHTVLDGALAWLTRLVNKSTGIGHPMDYAMCVEMLYALKERGVVMDASSISRKLIQQGWSVAHAKRVADLAARIAAGKKVVRDKRYALTPAVTEAWAQPYKPS